MLGDVKYINNQLVYEAADGKYYPLRIAGSGAGGGVSRSTVISLIEQLAGGGVNVESGNFTRTVAQGSGAQIIPTTKKAKIIFFTAKGSDPSGNGTVGSFGKSDLTRDDCVVTISSGAVDLGVTNAAHFTKCIWIGDVTLQSSSAAVTAISNNSYTLTWIITGGATNVDVQWHAITE